MTPQDLLLEVFCLIDDELRAADLHDVRRRGPNPILADSEVITLELVGELWGYTDDEDLFRHFRTHYKAEFPALATVHRTTFVRQAANLWHVKELLRRRLADRLCPPGSAWLIDSFPLPVCRFGRARRDRRFFGQAAYGRDSVHRQTFYGFRVHLRTSLSGVVLAVELAAANASEPALVLELLSAPVGTGIGDRNYWAPVMQEAVAAAGGRLLAPYKHASRDPDPKRSRGLMVWRKRIETTIGQLVSDFGCRRVKVKDLWHLRHRLIRKILSHTVGVWLNVEAGREPLQLEPLRAA